MITAASDPPEECPAAAVIASLNTFDAPAGRA
jgi:hypothetical protein